MCPCAGFLVCSRRPSFLVRELRQANEILRKASAYLAQAELDIAFIGEDHRKAYGVEPIRKVLPSPHRPTMRISPSASHDVSKRSERNPELKIEVQPRKRDTIACNTSVSPIRTEDQPAPTSVGHISVDLNWGVLRNRGPEGKPAIDQVAITRRPRPKFTTNGAS
jgi:hypothetical protein